MGIKNLDQRDVGLNSTGELNLYLDLLAFSELPPEEQIAYKERLKVANCEQVLEAAGEFPGFVEAIDRVEDVTEPNETSGPVFELLPATEQPTVEPETTEPPAAPVVPSDSFKASGPLSITGFLFDPTSKASPHVMALAVCASCGSETDGEDLFCLECGAFIDEKAEAQVSGSPCDDCGLIVTDGELICPACGSVSIVC